MSKSNHYSHLYNVSYDVYENVDNIASLCSDMTHGRFEDGANDVALFVDMDHILDHLVRPWHGLWMTSSAYDNETQSHFEVRTNSIPNWGDQFTLLDGWFYPELDFTPPNTDDNWMNSDGLIAGMQDASAAIDALSISINPDATLPSRQEFAVLFGDCLRRICLAWHRRLMTEDMFARIDPDLRQRMANTIPNWCRSRRLVSSDDIA